MKVVLDANVFVSATISDKGNPAKILQYWQEGILEVILSPPILDEISRVIYYPRIRKRHNLSDKDVEIFLRLIAKQATVVEPNIKLQVIEDDPDDDKYIECATTANAQFIITGDKHLLDLKNYEGIEILSPSAFLVYLQFNR